MLLSALRNLLGFIEMAIITRIDGVGGGANWGSGCSMRIVLGVLASRATRVTPGFLAKLGFKSGSFYFFSIRVKYL